jgi:hypothetical protein
MGYWEGAGQVAGVWLGVSMAMATAPVIVMDGPLPVVDLVWLGANIKNTDSLRRRGGRLGKSLDDYLAEEAETGSTVGTSWSASPLPPKTSSKKNTEYEFNKLPAGTGIKFDSILNFDNLLTYDFSNMDFNFQVNAVQDLTYVNRNSQWPEWND